MNRRRFMQMMGATAGAAILPMPLLAMQRDKLYQWRGILLGAETGFQLYHDDAGAAKDITLKAVKEIQRLESIFSLYQGNSAISQLNKKGQLSNAPIEMLELLNQANHFSQLTQGAFDVTVQPLWNLYAKNPQPTPAALHQTLATVGYENIEISGANITLHHNAQLTLNGIAQGFITDKITQLLKSEGITKTLVELGETHGLGKQWNIGLRTPHGEISEIISIENNAIATSGAYGTPLGDGNHLLNSKTGQSAKHHKSVSIIAPNATMADALSTGLSILPYAVATNILNKLPKVEARFS